MAKDATLPKAKKRNRIKEALSQKGPAEEEKVPAKAPSKKRGRPKKPKLFEGSAASAESSYSQSASRSNTPASELSAAADELVSFDYSEEMLFVGLIDSVRDETSYNQLQRSMWADAAKYQTDFWEEHKSKPVVPARSGRPKTAEEVKAAHALLDEVTEVLEHEQYTDKVFYRPRKEISKLFIDNIEKISGQLVVQGHSIEDLAKCYKMSKAEMTELVRHYLKRSGDRMRGFSRRLDNNEVNEKLIADQLKRYLNSRAGLSTTVRMMRDYLKTYFEDKVNNYAGTGFKLSMINIGRLTKILKERLNYRFKQTFTRPPQAFDPMFMEHRAMFPLTTKKLGQLGYNFIYIDEAAVAADNLSTRSW